MNILIRILETSSKSARSGNLTCRRVKRSLKKILKVEFKEAGGLLEIARRDELVKHFCSEEYYKSLVIHVVNNQGEGWFDIGR